MAGELNADALQLQGYKFESPSLPGFSSRLLSCSSFAYKIVSYIPLTNRLRAPYCEVAEKFFSVDLWPNREAEGKARAKGK